ncbi:MAG: thiamine diphosphokinase [Lachnospiraceae bacterium]|nr:thiamine diphosphokinase [Lachnospiraceae bacterium]
MGETTKKGKCLLIGAGDLTVSEIKKSEEDYCIALDGGIGYCDFLQIEPDLIIGDFDSVTEEEEAALEAIESAFPERVIRLKPEKDDTDMLYALKYALELGYRDFRLYAATGGRFDHTLANIQCLLYLKNHGATGYLMDGNGMIMIIKDETVRFRKDMEGTLSLFSLREATKGVTIEGMKYELSDAVITNDFPIGISNEFVGKEASITVEDGELACMILYGQ